MTFQRLIVAAVAKLYSMGFSDCHPQNALHVPKNERMLSEDKRIADVFSSANMSAFFLLLPHVLSPSAGRTS